MLDKIIGSLIGLSVGDALGAPYEFKTPPFAVSEDYIVGGVHGVKIGEWSDDTSMALCLAQSLIYKSGFDANNQMQNYLAWYEDGYFSTRDKCFDIGNTVAQALRNYKSTKEPFSGIKGDENSGNGSLMRLAPIAIFYHDDSDALIRYASKSSQTTHKSELAVDACIYFSQLIAGAINGLSKEEILSSTFVDKTFYRKEVGDIIDGSYRVDKIYKPTGYVINTLETALMAFYRFDSFEDGLLHVVSPGYDTDTVGAVYGQLAGAFYGYKNIPKRWTSSLVEHDMIYNMAKNLHEESKKQKETKQVNIHILIGDITTVNSEAVVNSANKSLLVGGGVDGAIHKAGGVEILKECKFLRENRYPDGLPIGEAVITSAGNLKAKYVIHTVGPRYKFDENPQEALKSCYAKSFLLADKYRCNSIAFPSISTGIYAYPKKEADKIAYDTICSLLPNARYIEDVIFVFYSKEDAGIFKMVVASSK